MRVIEGDMERLLYGQDRLSKSFQDYMKKFGTCDKWPTLWFDNKHILKLGSYAEILK